MTKTPKPKQPAAVPEIAENQKAAAKLWKIPLAVTPRSGCVSIAHR